MKTLYVCFSIIMLLLFSGCASDDELKSLKEENQRLKEENEQMKRVYFGEEITKENHSSSADIEGIPIALGKPFSSQNKAEITIQKVFFTDDVVPEKKSNFYTHYPAGDGKIYIAAVTTIKNLTSKEIEADKCSSKIATENICTLIPPLHNVCLPLLFRHFSPCPLSCLLPRYTA